MKKILSLLLCISCFLSLCTGCGKTAPAEDPTETTVDTAKEILDGKKILFIGNSHTYVGKTVLQVFNSVPQQEKRNNDQGLFYQICKKQGCEVKVTNWTFSSHGLSSIFGNPCSTTGACQGINHEDYLTDRHFDYVVIQPGVGQSSEANIATDIAYIVDFFQKENPDVKFILSGNASVYGNNSNGKTYPGITSYYKTLAQQDFLIADWGKVVNDLIKGECTPSDGSLTYEKSSFIIKDGFHPNMLSGYIAAMMLYSVITGQPAAQIPADMFQDTAMSIMVEDHLASSYERGEMDTNFHTVLTMKSELTAIHKLIDQYLAEKPYLNN